MVDPHSDWFCVRNLDPDAWRQYQQDSEVKELCDDIKRIIDRGALAVVSSSDLTHITWRIFSEVCKHPAQLDAMGFCWTAVSICMVVHAAYEFSPSDQVVKFCKSSVDHPAWYGPNVKVYYDHRGWVSGVRYETEAIRTTGNRENDTAHGAFESRAEPECRPAQASLFDLY